MSRDYRLYLQDILEGIGRINTYLVGYDFDRFKQDQLIIDAINMNLIIIGETANGTPDWLQHRYPMVDWRNIIGLRNILTHEYFRLNLARLCTWVDKTEEAG